jgi:hypothetical protein
MPADTPILDAEDLTTEDWKRLTEKLKLMAEN